MNYNMPVKYQTRITSWDSRRVVKGHPLITPSGRAAPFALALGNDDPAVTRALSRIALTQCNTVQRWNPSLVGPDVSGTPTHIEALLLMTTWVETYWDLDKWLVAIEDDYRDYGFTGNWRDMLDAASSWLTSNEGDSARFDAMVAAEVDANHAI